MVSVKLGRRVTAYSRSQFDLLLAAEVSPHVKCYCERPVGLERQDRTIIIDLWQNTDDGEAFASLTAGDLPDQWMDIPVRHVSPAELAAQRCWLGNWERMLPAVITTRDLVPRPVLTDIRRLVSKPMSLVHIERELVTGEPTIVRGGVFRLLLDGSLVAPSLRTAPLSLMTVFEPTS
jgi:hypothetical protein